MAENPPNQVLTKAPERKYRVLMKQLGTDDNLGASTPYDDLGVYSGAPEAAIAAACEARKVNAEMRRVCVAIPLTNWNEREVIEDPQPRFKVRPVVPDEAIDRGQGAEPTTAMTTAELPTP